MVTKAQRRASRKWDAANSKKVTIAFYPSEKALLEHLNAQSNKAGYIKGLIRKDIKNN